MIAVIIMQITATELKGNLGKYLEKAANESVVITQYGKPVAKLVGINDSTRLVDELFGSVPSTMTIDEALQGRLEA